MAKYKKQYVVIGLGNFGFSVVKTLYAYGADVMAIDKDIELVNAIEPYCTQAICMDAMDERALQKIGINNFDEAIVSMASDTEASIFVCLSLLQMGIQHITAKAKDDRHKIVLEKLGVTKVIVPEEEMGHKVALNMVRPNMIEVLSLSDKFSLVEIKTPLKWQNKSVIELDLRKNEKVTLIAVKRGEETICENIRELVLEPDDLLLLYGSVHDMQRLSSKATKSVL